MEVHASSAQDGIHLVSNCPGKPVTIHPVLFPALYCLRFTRLSWEFLTILRCSPACMVSCSNCCAPASSIRLRQRVIRMDAQLVCAPFHAGKVLPAGVSQPQSNYPHSTQVVGVLMKRHHQAGTVGRPFPGQQVALDNWPSQATTAASLIMAWSGSTIWIGSTRHQSSC